MKKYLGLLLVLIFIFSSGEVNAEGRVTCEVQISSDQSAQIKLKWSDSDKTDPIRIISWTLVDENTLKITYEAGKDVITGWDSRKIEGSSYHFPMKILLEEKNGEGATFTDLPVSEEGKSSILNLYYRGIISGYPDGSFKPDNPVTRAEFAKMVTAAAEFTLLQNQASTFKDVKDTYWAKPYIMTLADKGIFKGRTDGSFDATGSVTVGEVLAVINRTFVLYDEGKAYPYTLSSHWSNEDFKTMVIAGIAKSSDKFYIPYTPNVKATREQCAVLLSRVLEQLYETK